MPQPGLPARQARFGPAPWAVWLAGEVSSSGALLGKAEREPIYVHPPQWYAEHDIDLRLGVAVTGIDPAAHEVGLADSSRVGYSKLLLATGS